MEVLVIRNLAFEVVHQLVLIDKHGIVAAHSGLQQAVRLLWIGWSDHAYSGNPHEYLLHARRMLGAELVRRPPGRTNHNGCAELPAGHVPDLCRGVEHLVHRQPGEVHGHDLDDGAHVQKRRPDSQTREPVFGDGCVDDPIRAVLLVQSFGGLVRPAGHGDVLAHRNDHGIMRQLLVVGSLHRLPEHDLGHQREPP